MRKILNKTNLLFALAIMLIACLVGATGFTLAANAQEEPTSTVELTSYTSVMYVGEDFEFAANTEVTWKSSDAEVIDIDETGYAVAYAEGNATITATAADGATASIDVLVSDEAILVEGVTLNAETRIVYKGETYQLEALVLPEEATDKNVTWKSSDESVATVDANGLVTALAVGEADITVTTNDHMFTATCAVTIIDEQ